MAPIVPPSTRERTPIPLDYFTAWLASGERGISSEAIVSHLTGQTVGRRYWGEDHPRDPDDFRRCQLLLRSHPLAKLTFGTVRSASPQWARLVDIWDEIHESIESEAPGYLDRARGSAPRAYRLMRCAIEDGLRCVACGVTGRGQACPKCKGTGRRSGGRCRAAECWQGYTRCPECRGEGFTRGGAR